MITADLIERVEGAKGPSKALDREIARALGWHRVEPRHCRSQHGAWIAPGDFLGVNRNGSPRLDGMHGTTMHRDVPDYGDSLDAAVTLVPKGLCWTCGQNVHSHYWVASINILNSEGTPESMSWGHSKHSAARAVGAAALRARMAMEGA